MNKDSLFNKIRSLFRYDGRLDIGVIILFFVVNALVLTNSILHHPKIGYDVTGNINYIQILLHRFPGPNDSNEFFSPPLPYFLPSVFDAACNKLVPGTPENLYGIPVIWACRTYDGKFAQALNFFLSIGVTLLLLMISEQIKPGNRFFKMSVLMFLVLLTVYYKTFSQVRAEPYVAFFATLSVYLLILILKSSSFGIKYSSLLGISLGLLVLSRQWGFFFFPAILVFLVFVFLWNRSAAINYTKMIAVSFAISALVGGWFYIHLYLSYGSFTAFNMKPQGFSLASLPPGFFRTSGLKDFQIFKNPVRPLFDNGFFPLFYSDTWGDYWGFFTYHKQILGFSDNSATVAPYLGQVNLFSIIPSILLLLGAGFGLLQLFRRNTFLDPGKLALALIILIAFASLAGFMWFVISYFSADPSVLKATYIIQLFIALLFPAAEFLELVRSKSQWSYWAIIAVLGIVFVHNLPAMITNFRMF